MTLVEIFLPLRDNDGNPFDRRHFDEVRDELTEQFGGVTIWSRSPAEGLWDDGAGTMHDDVVIHEVMAEDLDRAWWSDYRARLEKQFRQERIVVRASAIDLL